MAEGHPATVGVETYVERPITTVEFVGLVGSLSSPQLASVKAGLGIGASVNTSDLSSLQLAALEAFAAGDYLGPPNVESQGFEKNLNLIASIQFSGSARIGLEEKLIEGGGWSTDGNAFGVGDATEDHHAINRGQLVETFQVFTSNFALDEQADVSIATLTLDSINLNDGDLDDCYNIHGNGSTVSLEERLIVSSTGVFAFGTLASGCDLIVRGNATVEDATATGHAVNKGQMDTAIGIGKFSVISNSGTTLSLDLPHVGKYVRHSGTAVQIPLEDDVFWPPNTELLIEQTGTGQITIAGDDDVTILSPETMKTAKQYAVISLKYLGGDLWILSGNLEAT